MSNVLYPARSVSLEFALFKGDPLTPELQEEWRDWQAAVSEAEHCRDLLGLVDVGDYLENGIPPIAMLTARIIGQVHQTWYGPKETAKTWLALLDVREVLAKGGTVLWVDKEMGRREILDRLHQVLGVPTEALAERFIYCEYPSLDCSHESQMLWRALVDHHEPDLCVVDAQTEVLADGDLNENSSTDIARWHTCYLDPVLRRGGATLMLDHTGHDEQGRARGGSHKGAAAKLELAFAKPHPFDKDTVGTVELTRTKNSLAADIPEVQRYRIGGSPFTFEQISDLEYLANHQPADPKLNIRERVEAWVREHAGDIDADPHATGLTVTGIREAVSGMNTAKDAALREAVDDPDCPLYAHVNPGTGRARYYWRAEKPKRKGKAKPAANPKAAVKPKAAAKAAGPKRGMNVHWEEEKGGGGAAS